MSDKKSEHSGISVIIPVYNREGNIAEAINSVLQQETKFPIQIVVSDDSSTDNTMEVLTKFNGKITIVKSDTCHVITKRGAAAARNRGIKVAVHDYIAFLDSDDIMIEGHLQKCWDALQSDCRIGYVFSKSLKEYTSNGVKIKGNWTRARMTSLDKEYHVLFRSHCINTNVIVARSDILKLCGEFDEDLSLGEDSDMWIRLSELSKGGYLNHFGAVYKVDANDLQLTKNKNLDKIRDGTQVYIKALNRYILRGDDKIRLALIIRALIGLHLHSKGANRYVISIRVLLKLFFNMPVTMVKMLYRYMR